MKLVVKICPNCRSDQIIFYMGGILGIQYKCKNCGYIGALIIEKELDN